jgi:hypothetical protein
MNYHVVEADSLTDLINSVNGYIDHGFRPIGGVMSTRPRVSGQLYFYQAIEKQNGNGHIVNLPTMPKSRGRPKKNFP